MIGGRVRRRHYLYAAVGLVCLVVVALLLRETWTDPEGRVWHEATFFGSVLLTIGWIVTSEVNINNVRRQHTITLITQHAFDPNRSRNRDIIRETLPTFTTRLTRDLVDFDDEASPVLKAIDLELNFYEFMALGCSRDDLDEHLLRLNVRGQFCSFYRQTEEYVAHWQAKNAATWCGLSALYRQWTEADSLAAGLRRVYLTRPGR